MNIMISTDSSLRDSIYLTSLENLFTICPGGVDV